MALYSVHIQGNGPQSAAEAALVRQAFSWKAFFFGPLWLAWHRLWAGLALLTAAYAILFAAALKIISAEAGLFISFALQFLLGLEANRLREAKLGRQGYRLVEIISAPARDEAEAAFYRHFEAPDGPRPEIASGGHGGALP
ncbi:MAG: DUF2628 domain-containing protein [Beijerinckiaceae bacterium]